MSARAMASGTVSFGLVSVPVKIYSTTKSAAKISFHWLHEKCGTRVKMPYYCPKHEAIVPRDELVKGYEVAKGRYVKVEPAELAAALEQPSESISIAEFVPADAVSPLYYDTAYYLGPAKGGAKAYSLLAEVMKRTGRVAIARQAVRGQLNVVMLRAEDGLLIMQQLKYAEELRPPDEIDATVARQKFAPGELQLAEKLVEQIAAKTFEPSAYRNEVRERLLALIERKVKGEDVITDEAAPAQAKIVDLMEALKASLGAGEKPARRPARRAAKRKHAAPGGRRRHAARRLH